MTSYGKKNKDNTLLVWEKDEKRLGRTLNKSPRLIRQGVKLTQEPQPAGGDSMQLKQRLSIQRAQNQKDGIWGKGQSDLRPEKR